MRNRKNILLIRILFLKMYELLICITYKKRKELYKSEKDSMYSLLSFVGLLSYSLFSTDFLAKKILYVFIK